MPIMGDHAPQNLHAIFAQSHSSYEDRHRAGPSHHSLDPTNSPELFCDMSCNSTSLLSEQYLGSSLVSLANYNTACHSPALSEYPCSNPSSAGTCFSFGNLNPQIETSSESIHTLESLPSYQNSLMPHFDDHLMLSHCNTFTSSTLWPAGHVVISKHQLHHLSPPCEYTLLPQDQVNYSYCLGDANGREPVVSVQKEKKLEMEWLYSEAVDGLQKSAAAGGGSHKRPCMTGGVPSSKRHYCTDGPRKSSRSESVASKSCPPSINAAKNRRERISGRLKILQDLVPNGTKLDLVTMLDKAISYVKFLQLQVKVLATDDFWPTHGGKVPGHVNEGSH